MNVWKQRSDAAAPSRDNSEIQRKRSHIAGESVDSSRFGFASSLRTSHASEIGATGIFVEVNGKYYLNEERLRQIQEQRAGRPGGGGGYNRQRPPGWMRYGGILLMLPVGIIVIAFLWFYFFYLNGGGYFPGEIILILLVVLVVAFVVRMLFWRARRNYMRERWTQNKAL